MKICVCTLIMLGDSYLPGALTLIESFKKYNRTLLYTDTIETLLLYTKDVSKTAIERAKKSFDKVKLIEYFYYPTALSLKKATDIYHLWINFSFTKWRIFDLHEYSKVLFLDADMLVVDDISELLLKTRTPAARFYGKNSLNELQPNGKLFDPFYPKWLKHNEQIEIRKIIKKYVCKTETTSNFSSMITLIDASCILITPDKIVGTTEKKLNKILYSSAIFCYNNTKIVSGPDEIIFCLLFEKMYNISPQYSFDWHIYDNPKLLKRVGQPKIYNQHGTLKPWKLPNSEFPDVKLWWKEAPTDSEKYIIDQILPESAVVIPANITKFPKITTILPLILMVNIDDKTLTTVKINKIYKKYDFLFTVKIHVPNNDYILGAYLLTNYKKVHIITDKTTVEVSPSYETFIKKLKK